MIKFYITFALLLVGLPAPAAEPIGLPKLVELVHSDKQISALDRQETDVLDRMLDVAADPDWIRKRQMAWIVRMVECTDRDCVEREYRQRLAELPLYPRATWKTYRNETLGISFQYLDNRRVGACSPSMGEACVAVFIDKLAGDDFEIAFQVFEKPMKNEKTSSSCAKDGVEVTVFVNCFHGVVGNGTRSVVAQTWGAIDAPSQRSLRTLHFLR